MRKHWSSKIPFIAFLCLFAFCFPLSAQDNLPEIFKKIEPSTVVIVTYDKDGKPLAQGSGFFVSKDGEIITNRHVLENADKAEIKTSDGKVYPVTQIIGEDKEADIVRASTNISGMAVNPLSLSNSVPQVGEHVAIIGSPLGLERTISDGIVSAVRDIPAFGKIIQITAPMSPGSSGSPVVNMKGEVIGIATFQMVEGQNLNFAIPSEKITKLNLDKKNSFTEWGKEKAKIETDAAEKLYQTGRTFVLAGNYEKALQYFDMAIKINPRYADAYLYVGICHYKMKRYSKTIEAFKQAILIKPDYVEAYCGLGAIYAELKRYPDAVRAYKQAIRIKPDYAEVYINIGLVYEILKRYMDEVEICKQVIRIRPDYAEAYFRLGIAYGFLKRYSEAIEAYKQGICIDPNNFDYNNLGVAYDAINRYLEAIEAYKQAIRINPDNVSAHYNLGYDYLLIGDKISALEEYKILKNLDVNLANTLFNLIYQ